jgi:hypothetical protein
MMTVVLYAASLSKHLIIYFSLAPIVESFGSSCYIRQAGNSWRLTLRPGSQIGGYLLENGCLKNLAKGSTRSSSSLFGQFGSSKTAMSFARKASRFSALSWQSEMKACSGSELDIRFCRMCYSRIAISLFPSFLRPCCVYGVCCCWAAIVLISRLV